MSIYTSPEFIIWITVFGFGMINMATILVAYEEQYKKLYIVQFIEILVIISIVALFVLTHGSGNLLMKILIV